MLEEPKLEPTETLGLLQNLKSEILIGVVEAGQIDVLTAQRQPCRPRVEATQLYGSSYAF